MSERHETPRMIYAELEETRDRNSLIGAVVVLFIALVISLVLLYSSYNERAHLQADLSAAQTQVVELEEQRLSCGGGWYETLGALQACVVELERERAAP